MPVILQTFALSVTLRKLVHRTNSMAGALPSKQKAIDLTPYFGEADSVRTVKALGQAAGGFTLTIADQLSSELQDTIYALFEPMDQVEIRAARHPEDFAGQPLPLIMRGYISTIQRSETIGDDGTPQRRVVVRGLDSGKLWIINQVLWQFLLASHKYFTDNFGVQAEIGMDQGAYPVGDYMGRLVNYMNSKVEVLAAFGNQMVAKFKLTSTVTDGNAYMQGLANKNGAIWPTYVEAFIDRPWNECFIIDEEAQPTVYFRPTPYKDLAGKYIMAGAADPGSIDIDDSEILSLDVARSDARVANFYWTPPADGSIDTGHFLTAAAIANATPIETDYTNDSPVLYGQKLMEVPTTLYPTNLDRPVQELPPEQRAAANSSYMTWTLKRSVDLKAMNRDNSVLEEGSATVNGREVFRIGRYARITRGSVISEAYMTQVAHIFVPFQSWTTSLTLERGTGFYNRDQASNVPFFAEGRRGPYTS